MYTVVSILALIVLWVNIVVSILALVMQYCGYSVLICNICISIVAVIVYS